MKAAEKGLALVAVLWAITLLSIMAASFSLSMQRDGGLVKNAQERARGLALADAGVHYAMLMLSLPDPMKRWRGDGSRYEVELPGGVVAVHIFDESGKIDINAVQEGTLRALFGKLFNGDHERAGVLTDAILDWRDNDDLTRLHGAEAKEYQMENKGYVPQNKNFQALEELQMVLGVTPALYQRLEPLLTIYSGQDGINPQKASREALMLLPGLDPQAVMSYLALRRAAPPNAAPSLQTPPGGVRLTGGGDVAYTVFAEARPVEGQAAGVKAVIRRQPAMNAPFAIAGWKRRILQTQPESADSPFPR